MKSEVVTIPLRSIWKKAPRWDRASRAVKEVKQTLKRRFRAKEVKIGRALNEKIWSRGGKKLPRKVRVAVIEEEDDRYYVELVSVGLEKRKKSVEKRKEEKKSEKEEPEEKEKEETKEEELKRKYMKQTPK